MAPFNVSRRLFIIVEETSLEESFSDSSLLPLVSVLAESVSFIVSEPLDVSATD